ncbi:MAG: NAD-dependent epimerase/dehydratase family protein [Parcubacteria group bacterium]|nr:NAD-dependent epimerase/dehydratase family protein [Parcubacteria group bacterium]
MKYTIFITGAAGYVGAMLCDQFSKRTDVEKIIALDKEKRPEFLVENKKIIWMQTNTADMDWQEKVKELHPDVVIHTAWQIRELYGNRREQYRWNVEGSHNVFDVALKLPSVKKLIYFSSAAVYGAYYTNSLEYRFMEKDGMREEEYSYGYEKKQAEEILKNAWEESQKNKSVFIVRPAAITGPRGRFMRVRFGLQSALSGQLKGDSLYKIISLMVSFVPATPWWVRQFIHEDDVTDIISFFAFEVNTPIGYAIFNITPPGDPVLAPQMARAVGKRVLRVYPWMVRLVYFIFWHISRGKVPTSRGVWRFYSYPIVMDGSKITRMLHYTYKYNSADAFEYTNGRYENNVPAEFRKHK